jgi:sigma-B regulation protein RsbU (phosphoserine phosphatase)
MAKSDDSAPPPELQKPPTRSRPAARYVVLAVLVAIAFAYQLRTVEARFPYWFGQSDRARWPFLLQPDDNEPIFKIAFLLPNALQAGLQEGDTLVAINNRPVCGSAVFGDAVANARTGDHLRVTVRSDGATVDKYVMLGPTGEGSQRDMVPRAFASGIVPLVGAFVMPLFCLLLGFWVVLIRPHDPLAWLLLAFLLGFTTFFFPGVESWGPVTRDLGAIYNAIWNYTWLIWLLLLAVYFPEPFPKGSAGHAVWTWLTWIIVAPLGAWSIANVIISVGTLENVSSVAALRYWVSRSKPLWDGFNYIGASLGSLVCIGWKWRTATALDSKRRLRLVLAGVALAFTPIAVLTAIAGLRHVQVEQLFPAWLYGTVYLLLYVFPLILAYVIMVQRAMDVRVVIRQGLQYALARRGVFILQILLSSTLFIVVAVLLTSHKLGPVSTVALLSAGLWGIFVLRGGTQRLAVWIDRRFFRDAYNADQILTELAEKVRTMVETQSLLETVTHRIADSLHVPRIAVLLDGSGSYRPAFAVGYGNLPQVLFGGNSATVRMLKTEQQPVRVYFDDPDAWIHWLPQMSHDERDTLAALRTELLLPLLIKEDLIGFLALGQKLSEEPYSTTDLRLLSSVAAQTALALQVTRLTSAMAQEIAHRERLNRELEIAREVQEHLFPQQLPAVAGLDYCGRCQPAREVGGDYYDFLPLPDGKLGIAVGDISGKGIGAALMMANLQASFRAQISTVHNLAELMARVNNLLCEASSANRYATFFYAQYEPATRELSYVNAGHNPPLVLKNSAAGIQIRRLEEGGPVIGLLRDARYQRGCFTLDPSDIVVLFTDGVSESMNGNDEDWGEARLVECAKTSYGSAATEMLTHIMDGAVAFAAGAPQHDDMTLVVLRVLA